MSETTRCERAAMWLFGREYSQQSLGIVDYWARLPEHRKNLVRQMLRELDACEVFDREPADAIR